MGSGERFALARTKVFELKFRPGETPHCLIHCSVRGCTELAEIPTKPQMPPSKVAERFRRIGWDVDNEGAYATCPGHVRTSSRPNRTGVIAPLPSMDEAAERMRAALSLVPNPLPTFPHEDAMPETKPPTATPNEFPHEMAEAAQRALSKPPTVDARKAQFAANRLLDEHYVEDLRRYEAGWSDARIATETGAAEAWVAETREAVYGPMGDPEVEALEGQLADVCTHYRQEIEGLRDL